MDVKINHGCPANAALLTQPLDSNRDVVEHTEARALSPKGMVRSAAQRSAPTMLQRIGSSAERCADRSQRSANQIFRPGQSHPSHGGRLPTPGQDLIDIIRITLPGAQL